MNRTATDSFGSSHPVITFTYFMVMVIFSMIFLHPLWMILSFGGAFLYSLFLKGSKALVFFAGFVLPVMVVSSLINPLFNHQGMTILFYFRAWCWRTYGRHSQTTITAMKTIHKKPL